MIIYIYDYICTYTQVDGPLFFLGSKHRLLTHGFLKNKTYGLHIFGQLSRRPFLKRSHAEGQKKPARTNIWMAHRHDRNTHVVHLHHHPHYGRKWAETEAIPYYETASPAAAMASPREKLSQLG